MNVHLLHVVASGAPRATKGDVRPSATVRQDPTTHLEATPQHALSHYLAGEDQFLEVSLHALREAATKPRLAHVVVEHPDCFIGTGRLGVSNESSHRSNSAIRCVPRGG
jgi:hypothetical protein